jgi:hypothetical protein
MPKSHTIDPSSDEGIVGVRCPSRTECVAADANGGAVTYNPKTGKLIRRHVDPGADGGSLVALACFSTTQCTAVDNDGDMGTFQPRTGKQIASAKIDVPVGLNAPSGDSSDQLSSIACPGATFCVAVDTLGNVVTFNPRSRANATPTTIDKGHQLNAIACPSTGRCVLVDSAGQALTGNPHQTSWTTTTLSGASALADVTCLKSGECVAVDSIGDAFATRS